MRSSKRHPIPVVILADPTCPAARDFRAGTSVHRDASGLSRCVAVRPSNSSKRVRRNYSETKRRQCDLPMLPPPAHATFWWCRLVATNHVRVGWRSSILRCTLPTTRKASPCPFQGHRASERRALSIEGRREFPLPADYIRPGLHQARVGGHTVAKATIMPPSHRSRDRSERGTCHDIASSPLRHPEATP